MFKNTKKSTLFAFILLAAMCFAQVAGAQENCTPTQKNNPTLLSVAVGETKQILYFDFLVRGVDCTESSAPFEIAIIPSSISIATISESTPSQTLTVVGNTLGNDVLTLSCKCTCARGSSSLITFDITVTAAPAVPDPVPPVPPAPPAPPTKSATGVRATEPPIPMTERGYERASIGNSKQSAPIYSGPGKNYDSLGQLPPGEVVWIYQWNAGETWCRVLYNKGNNIGWVEAKYIVIEK